MHFFVQIFGYRYLFYDLCIIQIVPNNTYPKKLPIKNTGISWKQGSKCECQKSKSIKQKAIVK